MIKDIRFTDFDGKDSTIRAIKCDKISKFEILVPEKYRIIYNGTRFGNHISECDDIDIESLLNHKASKKSFTNSIIVINLQPNESDYNLDIETDSFDADLIRLKMAARDCSIIIIDLDKKFNLDQVTYIYKQKGIDLQQYTWYIQEEPFCEKYYLAREYFN